MFQQKLQMLQHPCPEAIDMRDRRSFATIVLWLEDQKIRFYSIKDRKGLRYIDNIECWALAYHQYKYDIGVPICESRLEEISWLLDYAIYLQQQDYHKSDRQREMIYKKIIESFSGRIENLSPGERQKLTSAQNALDRLQSTSAAESAAMGMLELPLSGREWRDSQPVPEYWDCNLRVDYHRNIHSLYQNCSLDYPTLPRQNRCRQQASSSKQMTTPSQRPSVPQTSTGPQATTSLQSTTSPQSTIAPQTTTFLQSTEAPQTSTASQATAVPQATTLSQSTTSPESTTAPQTTTCLQSTEAPQTSTASQATAVPQATTSSQSTTSPESTTAPQTTTFLQSTEAPQTSTASQATAVPQATTSSQTTTSPESTTAPQTTSSPHTITFLQSTAAPLTSTARQSTAVPQPTTSPQPTAAPQTSTAPQATISRKSITSPQLTTAPQLTAAPQTSTAPQATTAPQNELNLKEDVKILPSPDTSSCTEEETIPAPDTRNIPFPKREEEQDAEEMRCPEPPNFKIETPEQPSSTTQRRKKRKKRRKKKGSRPSSTAEEQTVDQSLDVKSIEVNGPPAAPVQAAEVSPMLEPWSDDDDIIEIKAETVELDSSDDHTTSDEVSPPTTKKAKTNIDPESLRVAVADFGSPEARLKRDQWRFMELRILDGVNEAILRGERNIPLFGQLTTFMGFKLIQCDDQNTLEWLKRFIAGVKPPWENSKLRVIFKRDIPGLLRPKGRIILTGPYLPKEQIQRNLQTLNTELLSADWEVLEMGEHTDVGTEITILLSKQSLPLLRDNNFKVRVGITLCRVRPFIPWRRKDGSSRYDDYTNRSQMHQGDYIY